MCGVLCVWMSVTECVCVTVVVLVLSARVWGFVAVSVVVCWVIASVSVCVCSGRLMLFPMFVVIVVWLN